MTNPTIELTEYSSKIPNQDYLTNYFNSTVDERLDNLSLNDNDKRLLNESLYDILKILPLSNGLAITATSYVGVVNFSKFTVVVKPKIFIKPENLFGMINYAFELDQWEFPEGGFYYDQENYLIEIIVRAFVLVCENVLKQGLYKSYVTFQNNILYLKGKLLLKQHMINVLENRPQFACEYDELEYDNLENQIILFCLKRCYSSTKIEFLKRKIRSQILQFSNVVSDTYITKEDFKKINYTRQNQHYKKILDLGKIIIESSGIVDFYANARHKIPSFFVDMNEIFEKFVARLAKETFHNIYTVSEQESQVAWTFEEGKKKNIRTDILLVNKKTNQRTVLDTKYKPDLRESDYYQIFFYIYEYNSGIEHENQKTGYAILPMNKLKPLESKSRIYSPIQKIQIIISKIDLDEIIPLLYSKDIKSKQQLKDKIFELL